jgi:hypothetical protein
VELLTKGVSLPLKALPPRNLKTIARAIIRVWDELLVSEGLQLKAQDEPKITSKIEISLNGLGHKPGHRT